MSAEKEGSGVATVATRCPIGSTAAPAINMVRLEVPQHMRHAPSSQSFGSWADSSCSESGDPYSYPNCHSSAGSTYSATNSDILGMDFEGCTIQEVALAPIHLQECIVDDFQFIVSDTEGDEDYTKRDIFPFTIVKDVPVEGPPLTHKEMVQMKWKRLTGPLGLFLLVGLFFVWVARGHLLQLLNWLGELPWAERLIVFIVLFTLVALPFGFGYIILNMMAGYLYGLVHGQVVVMISVAIGFSVSFHICRSWLRDYAKKAVTSPSLQAVMRVVEGPHGLKVMALTRLTPIPFGLQNMLLSVTSVSYPKALLGTMLGLLPTQILNTYMGSTVRNMQEVLGSRADGYILLSAQVIFSLILMLYLLKKARSELAKLTHSDVETGTANGDGTCSR